jgi:hypothetical protein
MKLEEQLQDLLDKVIGQFDDYGFFVGRFYEDQLLDLEEYCGYPVFMVLLIEPKDETIYFAPISNWYITTMN